MPDYSYELDKQAQEKAWLRSMDRQRTKDAWAFLWHFYRTVTITAIMIVVMFVISVVLWTLILLRSL